MPELAPVISTPLPLRSSSIACPPSPDDTDPKHAARGRGCIETLPLAVALRYVHAMEWTDDAFVLGARRHGETSVILEAMTRHHGRHLGLVRGGRSKTLAPVLQPGNAVRLVWRARIDENLGFYTVEGLTLHAAHLMSSRLALYAVTHVAALVRLLPERDPHPALHEALGHLIEALADATMAPALVAR